MKAIAVDDEVYMLETLQEAVNASSDIETVAAFTSCSAALAYAADHPIDMALLDINMRGIGGLGLAEKLLELQKEIDHVKGVKTAEKLLTVQCFGNFEVFYNGEILPFRRKKTKEFLAVLIDRNGAGMTAKQICALLFPDGTDNGKNAAYLRQLVLDLKNTLKKIRAGDVLRHDIPYYRVDPNLIKCDYFSFLQTGKPKFRGEYMTQYSWAESTCGLLQFKNEI